MVEEVSAGCGSMEIRKGLLHREVSDGDEYACHQHLDFYSVVTLILRYSKLP